jgi:mRNA-degrading endonuclease RelE of RelBE toxin-antitoxin system
VDKFRVFYDVDTEGNTVLVKAIALKVGNKLLIRGKEFLL